jgi:F-type H+-transporting ATPase subunit b
MRGRHWVFVTFLGVCAIISELAWASEGGGHGGGHALNWYDFGLRLLNFVIMVAILVKLLKKPLGDFLVSRREGIATALAELEQQKAEAEAKAKEYQDKLATLDKEVEKIVSEYVQEGEMEKRKILEAAQKQAEYLKQQAQLAIQQEFKGARESLQEEIAELSVAAAEDILRKNIKAKDQERLVQEFMTKVVEAK